MIDFRNARFVKLGEVPPADVAEDVDPVLAEGERALAAFKGIRDVVVFTDRRVLALNVQGMTGKKKAFTSMPWARVQAFEIETSGTFDIDAEMHLWFNELGSVTFEFKGGVDVPTLHQIVGQHVL